MKELKALICSLRMFDGEAAAAQSAGSAEVGKSASESDRRESADSERAAASAANETDRSSDRRARREEFRKLVEEKYKDIYTEEFQSAFNRRHKEAKENAEKLANWQKVMSAVSSKYGADISDTDALLRAIETEGAAAAENKETGEAGSEQRRTAIPNGENGKTEPDFVFRDEQIRIMHREREVRRIADGWIKEAQELRAEYPEFDIAQQAYKPEFMQLLKANVPMRRAYEAANIEDIKSRLAADVSRQTEKQVVDTIRAKGMRARENGISIQSGVTLKTDVSRLTREQRKALADRAARGEEITFR